MSDTSSPLWAAIMVAMTVAKYFRHRLVTTLDTFCGMIFSMQESNSSEKLVISVPPLLTNDAMCVQRSITLSSFFFFLLQSGFKSHHHFFGSFISTELQKKSNKTKPNQLLAEYSDYSTLGSFTIRWKRHACGAKVRRRRKVGALRGKVVRHVRARRLRPVCPRAQRVV
jgi:hypothetical protein